MDENGRLLISSRKLRYSGRLLYYELWHMSGVWEGPGVGYENVAEMRVAEARRIRESGQDVH